MSFEHTLDRYIAAEMQQKHIPGLSLAIIKNGTTVIEKNYGLANVELQVPVTSDTVYEIASITKAFTATAIMLLVEEGRLQLDDPVSRFRSGLPAAWEAMTIRHLITHTSGIKQWSLDWDRPDLTNDEICQAVFGAPLRFLPGTEFEYTDPNYNLLGMIIHQLTGAPYDSFLHQRIFQPLGMTSTRHNAVREIVPHRAAGYEWADGRLCNSFRIQWNHINVGDDVPANGANGSLLSTLRDLIKWDAALTSEQILKRPSLDTWWSPVILNNGLPVPYEHDWCVQTYAGHKLVAFGGGVFGFTTSVSRFVDDHLTIIILTNYDDSKPWDMCKAVAGMYEPTLAPS
jgi:D-alanyl-D-alanine carboxypeptidase